MTELKRIDGKLCNGSCYNYKTIINIHFCRAMSEVGSMTDDYIYIGYKLINDEMPSWCPLGRNNGC